MNYPIWHIPFLGGSWLIGIVAIIHIFISHFAVGGGIFFAITEQLAYNRQDSKIYEYLKKHSKFFLLITTVAGAVTGVGIWWCISLVSPDGTATLIQNFTLGWATEYLFFVAEIATVFVYYYTWDKIDPKLHLQLAKWYAFLSVMTLVIINGILSFMLTPGKWLETGIWRDGFFNSTYLSTLLLRLLVMMAIAGMYSLLTSSRIQDEEFKSYMLKYSSKWFVPIFILGPIVGFWFFKNIPVEVINNVLTGIQSSGVGNFSILARAIYLSLFLSGTILVFALVGPYLNPKGFSFVTALFFLCCGLLVTGIGEWSREMLRKPYVIFNYMYSNGLRKSTIKTMQQDGFIINSNWAKANAAENPERIGEIIFKSQCLSCHDPQGGYRSMPKLLGSRDLEAIEGFLATISSTDSEKNPYLHIMPPLVANQDEIKALAKYLKSLTTTTN